MRKFWLIFKREYLTRLRSKGFVLSTIALPVLSIGLMLFSVFLATRQTGHTLKIVVLDSAGGVASDIARGLSEKISSGQPLFEVARVVDQPQDSEKARDEIRAQVREGRLDGYLVITKEVLTGKPAEYHAKNPGDLMVLGSLRRAVSDAVIARRLSDRGVHLDDLSAVVRGVDITVLKVTERGEAEEKGQTFLTALMIVMLLYVSMAAYGGVTLSSVLEEKTTRTVEVLVSSARPSQLLAGKLLGVAAIGLTQYLIWTITGWLLAAYGLTIARAFRPGASMPEVHLPAPLLVYLVVFFLAGYFLYASLFAAVGAMVSNEEESKPLQLVLVLPLIASIILFNVILRDPNSRLSIGLSLVPFFTPILMFLRIALQTPPFWQIALSLLIMTLTTVGSVYVSAKIYRVGILMYGKRPSLVELLRWLRYS